MAIDGLSFNQQYPFLGITRQGSNYQTRNYEPINQGVANTTPRVIGGFSAEDYEKANAIAEGNFKISQGENYFAPTGINSPTSAKGAAWDGFSTPLNNGTGELSPVVCNREDSIEDCPWREYYA